MGTKLQTIVAGFDKTLLKIAAEGELPRSPISDAQKADAAEVAAKTLLAMADVMGDLLSAIALDYDRDLLVFSASDRRVMPRLVYDTIKDNVTDELRSAADEFRERAAEIDVDAIRDFRMAQVA